MPRSRGSTPKPPFSVVVLTRNEAAALPRLLDGLSEFLKRGGEVLTVDTGSTDDTRALAQDHGCRVESAGTRFDSVLSEARAAEIDRRFERDGAGPLTAAGQRLFHFGNARQYAGLQATHEMVLQLDGSDELEALDLDAVTRWIESGVGIFDYEQQYGNVGLRIARFYDRQRHRWLGRVHELLAPEVVTGAAPISRRSCEASEFAVRHQKDSAKPRTYMAGLALQVLDAPELPRWWHYLGRELYYERRFLSAITVLKRHAEMPGAWAAERSQSLCFLGECLEELGRANDALEAYRRAEDLDATHRDPLLRQATLHCSRGEFAAAAALARRSLGLPQRRTYPELLANYTWRPHLILYWSLFWLGRRDEARRHWDRYRDLAPEKDIVEEHARLFPDASDLSPRGRER